jgi:hypothetical protein
MKILNVLFVAVSLIMIVISEANMNKGQRVYAKKKLNPFLMPYIMWMPYREDRKKQINHKLNAKKVELMENDMKKSFKKNFLLYGNPLYGE